MWSVSTILTGLLSFMVETQHTTGAWGGGHEVWGGLAGVGLTGLTSRLRQPCRHDVPDTPPVLRRNCQLRCLRAQQRGCCPCCTRTPLLAGMLGSKRARAHDLPAGAISSTPEEKKQFARDSLAYNVRNPTFR